MIRISQFQETIDMNIGKILIKSAKNMYSTVIRIQGKSLKQG